MINNVNVVKTSYKPEDVTMLLKDLTGKIEGKSTAEREKLIQSGVHYCEMLPIEYVPSKEYYSLYEEALEKYAYKTYKAVAIMSEKARLVRGNDLVIVSLARAGTPIGILMKHYLKFVYGIDAEHYTISIIRGRGIDKNAMKYIVDKHGADKVQFVDGWTGKGAILTELKKDIRDLGYDGLSDELAVLADPANICKICGTHEDFLIPSSCLNSTVSGLISRTVLRSDLIDEANGDFHGAVYNAEMEESDVSNDFLNKIESYFTRKDCCTNYMKAVEELHDIKDDTVTGMEEVVRIQKREGINDINLVKPGIGETTRVLLRRVPWKILVKDLNDTERLGHIFRLAKEKNVEVLEDKSLVRYNCIGIIKEMADA